MEVMVMQLETRKGKKILEFCAAMEWNKLLKSDTKERKVTIDIAKDLNAWKCFIRNCPIHASMEFMQFMQTELKANIMMVIN